MLEVPPQTKNSSTIYIEDTDIALPEKINPRTRYAFFSTIATGGKSIIKSCQDLHLRRTVCYKSLRSEFKNDPIENKRLLREARISSMLQHPNTVPTYEIGRDNQGHYYFTMKLIQGYTLREVLNYRDRYDLSQLIDVIIQVTRALGYAHIMGVLHRDIKPDNILVGPYGEVLLLDWGLAKVWHKTPSKPDDELLHDETDAEKGMTGEGKLQGTLMYMSPEQIRRDPAISFQSDLYSIGAILYEVLTGVTPFQGDKVSILLDQITTDSPIDPRTLNSPNIPDLLANLSMACLQKAPEKRPESADEVIRMLKESW